ncbi:MAG: cation transporter [Candidatus Eremiobacteraeota bacterium]|nr:cation transporter [Candidatus Eremiobacteraeota bacterium]
MRRSLSVGLALVAAVAALEFWGGYLTRSLALTADAVHVCMDAFALAIALAAAIGAAAPANRKQTFGFGRLEVLAALVNGALLFTATIFIAIEAVRRFGTPVVPAGASMSVFAAIGLAVNLAVGTMLARERHANLNVRAALYHVAGDALGALAVLLGGIAIALTRATWIDPALSLFVAGIIVLGVVRIARDAGHVLLESAPASIDTFEVQRGICAVGGVVDVHDLHVWSIGSREYALAAHVLLDDRRISEATAVLRAIEGLLRERFAIGHVTLQFECENCGPDERVICTQSISREALPD